MTDTETDTEERRITLFEIYIDDSNEVFHVLCATSMKTRVRLIRQQYKEYVSGTKSRKEKKIDMLNFIQSHGGIDVVKFRRLKTIEAETNEDVEELLLNEYLDATAVRGKEVKSAVKSASKREKCKQYYKQNRDKHLKHMKESYQKKRNEILSRKKKHYKEKERCYVHCKWCHMEVLQSNYERHCVSKNHVKNML